MSGKALRLAPTVASGMGSKKRHMAHGVLIRSAEAQSDPVRFPSSLGAGRTTVSSMSNLSNEQKEAGQ